jgi:hypothetical protein
MRHAFILAAILAAALSSIFFLPPFRETDSAMAMDIPEQLGRWVTKSYLPSEQEVKSLANDTRFSKAQCFSERPGSRDFLTGRSAVDSADVSIVLSGHDLANSIHRPERCMPAQGFDIYQSQKSVLEVPGKRSIPIRSLLSTRDIPKGKDPKDVYKRNFLTVYFFVGHQVVTEDHSQRTKIDMKDRLKKGEAQSWAYISVTTAFKGGEGAPPEEQAFLPDQGAADTMVREILSDLVARNIAWNQIIN